MRRRPPLAGCTGRANRARRRTRCSCTAHCAHIPNRFEHLVRYAGWYSNRSREKRRHAGAEPGAVALRAADLHESRRVRSTWARLIHKVYEVDPLECPMRVIALIDDAAVIRKILSHLGLWAPQRASRRGRGPPVPDPPGNPSPS